MEYTPLISYFDNFLLTFAITFAVASVVCYALMRARDLGEQTSSLIASTAIAAILGVAALAFTYNSNDGANKQIVKSNVEAKYDVAISNIRGVRQDDTASLFTAHITSNKDQSAYSISLIIANDGTPSIVNENGFNAETVAR